MAPRSPRPGISLQNLLLGLGTALVAIAALVFTAVSWNRMGATVQGLVLVGLTGLAVLATAAAARRRLPASAEAIGLVAVLFALADAHALRVGIRPDADAKPWWVLALVIVTVGAWGLGAATGVRSTRIAAALLGQLPLLVLLVGYDVDLAPGGLLLLAQVAVVLVGSALVEGAPPAARRVAAAAAAGTWTVVAGVAGVVLPFTEGGTRVEAALVLAAASAVAALAAWLWSDDDPLRTLGLLAASLAGFVAVAAGLSTVVGGDTVWPLVGLAAAGVVAAGLAVDRRWGAVPVTVGLGAAGLSLVPLLATVVVVVDAATRTWPAAWRLDAATRASTLVVADGLAGPGVLALHLLAAVALLGAVLTVVSRRGSIVAAALVGLAAMVVAPVLVPLSIGGTVAVALLAALSAALVTVLSRRGGGPVLVAVAASAYGLAWSASTSALSLTAVAAATVVAAMLLVSSRRIGEARVAIPAVVALALGLAVEVGLGVAASGRSGIAALVAAGFAALVTGMVTAQLLDLDGRGEGLDGGLAGAVEVVTWLVHAAVLGTALDRGDPTAVRLTLAGGMLAAGLHAVRPGRRWLAGLAVLEGLFLVWTQLGVAGVSTPEAYSLPLAAVLLGAGLVGARRAARAGEEPESWVTLGPALVVGFGPTLLLAVAEPGALRPLLGLVAGALVLVAGAATGRRAPVDVGATVVAVLGARQLAPVVGELPNWAVLGVTGLSLLAVGATFEQRRRDLRDVRDRYGALR